METRKNTKNKSIRKFIILWMSLLVFCFVIIALTLVLSTNKLQSMSGRMFMDSMAVEYAHQLETAILEERREDLLWRATNNPLYLEQTKVQTEELKNIIRQFSNSVTSPEEHLLIREIEKKFDLFETATIADPPIPIEKISVITDNLLQSVEKYRIQNRTQMAETIKVSSRLNTLVDRWSLFMIILVALMVAFGSITLINRIIHPVFVLIRTAKNFGQGDFSVKTPVYRNDELGALCETFNDMATGIKNNQQERLNFIATVAHDLKNPLVVVGAAARKLKKNNLSDDKQTIWLDYIIKNVEYLENLISDLMDSVQIESGKLTLHMSELDLTSLVSFIQQQQDELIKTHQIIFEGDSKCWIQGDTRRLERAV